jgi:hypothetical protein
MIHIIFHKNITPYASMPLRLPSHPLLLQHTAGYPYNHLFSYHQLLIISDTNLRLLQGINCDICYKIGFFLIFFTP